MGTLRRDGIRVALDLVDGHSLGARVEGAMINDN
jgi:hypothetical protein